MQPQFLLGCLSCSQQPTGLHSRLRPACTFRHYHLNGNKSGLCCDILGVSHLNFCTWITKLEYCFNQKRDKMMELLNFVRNETDFLQNILGQQVSLLPKYIHSKFPTSCLFGVYFVEFAVGWIFLLGDFIFLYCVS